MIIPLCPNCRGRGYTRHIEDVVCRGVYDFEIIDRPCGECQVEAVEAEPIEDSPEVKCPNCRSEVAPLPPGTKWSCTVPINLNGDICAAPARYVCSNSAFWGWGSNDCFMERGWCSQHSAEKPP